MIRIFKNRYFEKLLAGFSLLAAFVLAIIGLLLSPTHDIGSVTCMVIAQFLTLTATLLGFDYKFNTNGTTTTTRPAP